MPNRSDKPSKVRLTNMSGAPRVIQSRLTDEHHDYVTIAPGETAEVDLAFPDHPVYQHWLNTGELRAGLSEEDQANAAEKAQRYAATVSGQLPGNVQRHPVEVQNMQALTNTPGPLPPDAAVTQQPIPVTMPPAPPPNPPATGPLLSHPAAVSSLEPNLVNPETGEPQGPKAPQSEQGPPPPKKG